MKTLNLKSPLLDLNGKPVQGNPTLAQLLAGSLVSQAKGNPIKYFDWAIKLNIEGEIQVDDADWGHIKEFVEQSEIMTVLAKAQILKAMQ